MKLQIREDTNIELSSENEKNSSSGSEDFRALTTSKTKN